MHYWNKLALLIQWLTIHVKVKYMYWFMDHDEWRYEGDLDEANHIMRKIIGEEQNES